MTRSNGNGVPPNGWPADFAPDGQDPYQDPYYAQQAPRHPQAQPPQASRPVRTQPPTQPAASRVPQTGLPPGGLNSGPPTAAPPAQGYGQPYVPPPAHHVTQPPPQAGYGSPYGQPQAPQQQYPAQSYAPQGGYAQQPGQPGYPQQQAAAYPAQNSAQHPAQQRAPAPGRSAPPQQQADPRLAGYPTYDQAGVPPTRPPAQTPAPQYTQPPSQPQGYQNAYGQQNYGAPPAPAGGYAPETTGRPTQPLTQRGSAAPDSWGPPGHASGPTSGPAGAGYAPAPLAIDPQGFDLGVYTPSAAAEPRTQRPTAPPAWQPSYDPQSEAQHPRGDGRFDAANRPLGGYQAEPLRPEAQQNGPNTAMTAQQDHADYEDDDFEEPPRRTRYGLIAASLIVAIAAGGGLAYAYKVFVAPPQLAAVPPTVKSGPAPVKVKPADPGGTKFANTESKMMESLSGSQNAAGSASQDGGPRAVQTLRVERDGSVAPPPAVPGMIVMGGPVPQQQPTQVVAVQPQPQPQIVNVQPQAAPAPAAARPAAPRVIAAATPPPAAAAQPDVEAAPVAPPVKRPVPPAKKAATPPSAVGGPAPSAGTNGFVAVLASVPASASSRMQAMAQFADLQQKYAGVLASKAPDVVEAKLEKGTFHRLVVGPPASRDVAGSVCTQLKAAGYTADCWVTGF